MEHPDSKINILFVIMQMEMGGSERLVHNVVLNIDREFFNPSIAWFFGDRVLQEFKDLEIPLYHVPKTKRFDFSTMRKLGKITKDNNMHIVNAHHFMSMVYSFYGCKVKNNIKLIYTEHSRWEIEQIPWKWRRIGSFLLNHSDIAVGVNAEVTKLIQNIFKLDSPKAFTIPNGVDLKVFSKRRAMKGIKNELGIANGDKIIGMVANLKKVKNHLFLLKAFEKLIKDYKNVKLLLIGQGFKDDTENSEADIRRFLASHGLEKDVFLLGYRSDIPGLLGIMDVFCLTSFKEGLPISLIEAMAAGLPVVGSDVEGIRDVIIGGRNGYLVQLDDVKGLKKAIFSLLRDESLRAKMSRESKALAKSTYSLDHCINQYQDLFMSIIKK